MDIAITAGEEICGTHASRFEDLDDEMRMQALASDHLEGRLSEAHRLIVEIAINESPRDALLLQARALQQRKGQLGCGRETGWPL